MTARYSHFAFFYFVASICSRGNTDASRIMMTSSSSPSIDKVDVVMAEGGPTDSEKAPAVHVIDNFRVLGLTDEDADFYNGFSQERRKRIMRKVDCRLVPMLAILYLVSHLDRANIGNAKIEGLAEDLKCRPTSLPCLRNSQSRLPLHANQ